MPCRGKQIKHSCLHLIYQPTSYGAICVDFPKCSNVPARDTLDFQLADRCNRLQVPAKKRDGLGPGIFSRRFIVIFVPRVQESVTRFRIAVEHVTLPELGQQTIKLIDIFRWRVGVFPAEEPFDRAFDQT